MYNGQFQLKKNITLTIGPSVVEIFKPLSVQNLNKRANERTSERASKQASKQNYGMPVLIRELMNAGLDTWLIPDYRAPREDEFYIPHSLALDESRDLLCVADRENNRIQCFSAGLNGSSAGTFRDSFQPGEGPIYAIEYDQNGKHSLSMMMMVVVFMMIVTINTML